MQLPDGHDFNGARSPALLNCPVINQCGPYPHHFILPSTFPLLPCVIHSPLLFVWSPLFSSSTHCLPRVPFLFHVSLSPEGESSRLLPPFFSPSDVLRHPPLILSLLPCPYNPAPIHVMCLHAGLHTCSSSYSVILGGSARSHPDPEVLSWLGRSQSQEVVIEAVGGG
jgi:hypothetical protein